MNFLELILHTIQNDRIIKYPALLIYGIIISLLFSGMIIMANYEYLLNDFDTATIIIDEIMFSIRQITFIGVFLLFSSIIIKAGK